MLNIFFIDFPHSHLQFFPPVDRQLHLELQLSSSHTKALSTSMSCSRAARRARVAAHRSSTKHVGRLFPGSILGLPAARETMGACAEVILASAPVLELRLGRAQHHRVVPRSLPVAPAVSAILAGAKSDFMSSAWLARPAVH